MTYNTPEEAIEAIGALLSIVTAERPDTNTPGRYNPMYADTDIKDIKAKILSIARSLPSEFCE